MTRVYALTILLLGFSPCGGPGNFYEFRISYGDFPYGGGLEPSWGHRTPSTRDGLAIQRLWAGFPPGRVPPEPMVEIRREGELVPLPFVEVHGLSGEARPPLDAQLFELGDLPAGLYSITHRRRAAPDDLVFLHRGLYPWVVVDGEELLETTVFLGDAAVDAGTIVDADGP